MEDLWRYERILLNKDEDPKAYEALVSTYRLNSQILQDTMGKKNKNQEPTSHSSPNTPQIKKKFSSHDLAKIQPLTSNQKLLFQSFQKNKDKSFFLCGSAGTGKTFSAMYLSLNQILSEDNNGYDKLLIVRSAVPSRDLGFLPGDLEEKSALYEDPYAEVCDALFTWRKSYENLKEIDKIEFITTSYLRGRTFNNCIVLVDECQNMSFAELNTVMTRIGTNAKIIFSGDIRQTDLASKYDKSGFADFFGILRTHQMKKHFDIVEFTREDIVRSGIVKDYLIAKEINFDDLP